MKKYIIFVVITNRTNYSKLKLILKELKCKSNIDLKIIASSSILLEKYGAAYKDLESDGYKIDVAIDCTMMNDSHESMVNTVGLSMIKHSGYFTSLSPDLMVIVGDRFDTLATAITGMMMNIPIAHIQGGETTGTIDDKVRDLITIGSTLHFVSTAKSEERLRMIGVNKECIFNFGCPAIEYISSLDTQNKFNVEKLGKSFKREIKINKDENFFLILAHPDTTNKNDISIDSILSAIEPYKHKALIFYPNIDANSSQLLSDISKHKENHNYYFIKHMPLDGFVHAVAHAYCMVGNSSAGIREAATFGTPVVNIGNRQNGRERNNNTIDSLCDKDSIRSAIDIAIGLKIKNDNLYYKKDCSKNIVDQISLYLELKHQESKMSDV
jgi:UDP-hydrolysing UDP-N-acetyl-D-glucosamine 2-epimerase